MATAKKTPASKTKAKPAGPVRGDIVIARKDAAPAPKIPAGVAVWIIEGDTLHLTPADMYARGWIRSKA